MHYFALLLGPESTRTADPDEQAAEMAAAAGVRITGGPDAPRVTDGPFAEGAEVAGGYYVLEAADLDEALGLAGQIPACQPWRSGDLADGRYRRDDSPFGHSPKPTVRAVGFRDGFTAGLAALDEMADDPRLAASSTVAAIQADLLRRAGQSDQAAQWYRIALRRNASEPARVFLGRRLKEIS